MKLLLTAAAIVIVAIGLVLFAFFHKAPVPTSTNTNPFGSISGGTNTTGTTGTGGTSGTSGGTSGTTTSSTISIPTTSGGSITVANFKANSPYTDDGVAPYYTLEGNPAYAKPGEPYHINFYGSSATFVITLFSEPLGATRKQAEADLVSKLGLPQDSDLCSINVWVDTTNEVSDIYSGRNLGVSVCPGATPLP